jgi:hypothetical protein
MSGIIFGGTVTPSRLSPNLFKNPNFAVIQGTASGTLANSTALPTASLGYQGETEWCVAASGGTPAYAFSAVDERVTFTGAASTTAIYLLQRLESRDTNKLKNKTVTFSCEISNSLLTSVIWEVFRPTTTDDTHGTIASPTQTLIASGTFTVSSTLARYSATFALPTEASRGLEVRLRVGAQTSGTWVIARPQLEEGTIATAFNCDDFGKELRKCLRYYRQSYGLGIATGSTTDNNNRVSTFGGVAGTIGCREKFDIDMFSVPVTNTWDINGNSNSVITISSGGISTTRTPSRTQTTKTLFVFTTTSDVVIQFHYAASAHIP